ncbi:MAG: ATP-dependent RecD-like DNA helicase [Turicibacter sp.]|nr:ATP-dependent RecD-like DNA helicase [Turicibacter sp.]
MEGNQWFQGLFLDKIFHNEENSYIIASFMLLGHNAPGEVIKEAAKPIDSFLTHEALGVAKSDTQGKITVSGYFPDLKERQHYRFTGKWVNHPRFGWQFQATHYEIVQIREKSALIHYLSSDLFEGVGKKTAERIVATLGDNAIELILKQPVRLDDVPKLPAATAKKLHQQLVNQQGTEQVLAPLYGYNLSPQLVMKIFKRYEYRAVEIVEGDPYRLIEDIEGIGFLRADELARKVGYSLESPKRIRAAMLYVIDQIAVQRGHTYVYRSQLLESALGYLNKNSRTHLSPQQLEEQIEDLIRQQKIIAEGEFLFIPKLVSSEIGIVDHMMRLLGRERPSDNDIEKTMKKLLSTMSISYSPEQETAISMALKEPVSIITGGPGTGKTTVVQGILKGYGLLHGEETKKISLAAPTGRAAKRMAETTGLKASTLHRLLGYSVDGDFQFDEDTRLNYDLIIVDESSMLDTFLAYQLIQSIRTGTQLLLVGDDNQLPSVGPGQVLKDLLECGVIPVTRLLKVHRQAEGSSIIQLANAVKQNTLPADLSVPKGDFLFKDCHQGQIKPLLQDVVAGALKKGYNPGQIQVLVPLYRGENGIDSLNFMLQELFNPKTADKRELIFGEKAFRIGDKVLQLSNQPETEVMNGDVGEVIGISLAAENKEKQDQLIVDFDEREVAYKKGDLIQLTHAYCVSVHKSQGSEYPIVIMPMTNQYHVMLQKKLIYTAITRAKQSLVIIGEESALVRGVQNEGDERQTTLKLRFQMQTRKDGGETPENPYAEYFKLYGIPFARLDELRLKGVTPYDFM